MRQVKSLNIHADADADADADANEVDYRIRAIDRYKKALTEVRA